MTARKLIWALTFILFLTLWAEVSSAQAWELKTKFTESCEGNGEITKGKGLAAAGIVIPGVNAPHVLAVTYLGLRYDLDFMLQTFEGRKKQRR